MTRRLRLTAARWAAEREPVRGESRPGTSAARAGGTRPAINPAEAECNTDRRVGLMVPFRLRGVCRRWSTSGPCLRLEGGLRSCPGADFRLLARALQASASEFVDILEHVLGQRLQGGVVAGEHAVPGLPVRPPQN